MVTLGERYPTDKSREACYPPLSSVNKKSNVEDSTSCDGRRAGATVLSPSGVTSLSIVLRPREAVNPHRNDPPLHPAWTVDTYNNNLKKLIYAIKVSPFCQNAFQNKKQFKWLNRVIADNNDNPLNLSLIHI